MMAANPMLDGPLLPLLARLALPTVVVMFLVTLLSVAETYFVSVIGTDAIAAASLVVPVILLMTMVSNGGIGGGVSSAIGRARGAGQEDEAQSLAWHAFVLGLIFGLGFTLVLWMVGPTLYHFLGGRGASLEQAVLYSNILFGGAAASWVLTLLQSALRGTGNVKVPALIIASSVFIGLLISPALISGWYGLPPLGVAGAGVAQVLTNLIGLSSVVVYMRSKRSSLRLQPYPLRRDHFAAILRVGLPSSVNAAMSNLALTAVTAAAGSFGVDAIAGYGIASRIDSLLVPILFGFGTAALTVVATNLGARQVARARRAAILNAIFVACLLEGLGLLLAFWPELWLGWFTHNPEVLKVGALYLLIVGPTYGLSAISMELYFAGQGASRIGWPMVATATRLAFAVLATALAASGSVSLSVAFFLVAAGVVASAVISLWGFARTSWEEKR
ncbi:Multidrug export protein MepA [Curvibacter sp. AEP1-3]|uniref:MATE family efflux transporter n=1 Tax=Curvibacter sp. AEP1-3 TaxID=1844971 RepID=UPI000B3CF7B4|nr:MATE family efflux transporter [Curvibacter sp. AEP1-3]ARV20512.1 Multidrug export protein MepA [Curvibacter sp. AEP1-3]